MAGEDQEFNEMMKDWQVCFSKRKQRDYYFNPKTGESFWDLDEIKERVRSQLKSAPKSSKQKSSSKTSSSKDKNEIPSETSFEMQIDPPEDQTDQMDYEITEINKIRMDTNLATTDLNVDVEMNQIDIDPASLKLILVLDTNIFISNLRALETVAAKYKDTVLFSVPWVVVQELDGLKSSGIREKATQAIHFIHSVLSARAAVNNFVFENSIQSQQGADLIKSEKNDDKILRCALRLSTECPDYHVIVITNDVNLINKSIISNIESINFVNLVNNLDQLVGNGNPGVVKSAVNQLLDSNQSHEPFINEFFGKLSQIYEKQINELIIGALSIFFEFEMRQTYQDLWLDLLLHKPPWSLATIMPNLNKSFSALFGFSGQKNSLELKSCFESLKEKITSYLQSTNSYPKSSNFLDRLRLLVKISIDTLHLFDNFDKNRYGPLFGEYINKLDFFKSNGVKICNVFTLICKFSNETKQDVEPSNGVELLERIWQKYESMSHLSVNLVRHHFEAAPKNEQSKLLFEIVICIGSIHSFRTLYQKCLADNSALASLSRAFYALLKLFNFENENSQVYLLNVHSEFKKYEIIEKTLTGCFADSINRGAMRKGLDQLREFEEKFDSMNLDEIFSIVLKK